MTFLFGEITPLLIYLQKSHLHFKNKNNYLFLIFDNLIEFIFNKVTAQWYDIDN